MGSAGGREAHAAPRNRALEKLHDELRGRTIPSREFVKLLRSAGVRMVKEDSGHFVVKDEHTKSTAKVPSVGDMNHKAMGNVIRQLARQA